MDKNEDGKWVLVIMDIAPGLDDVIEFTHIEEGHNASALSNESPTGRSITIIADARRDALFIAGRMAGLNTIRQLEREHGITAIDGKSIVNLDFSDLEAKIEASFALRSGQAITEEMRKWEKRILFGERFDPGNVGLLKLVDSRLTPYHAGEYPDVSDNRASRRSKKKAPKKQYFTPRNGPKRPKY